MKPSRLAPLSVLDYSSLHSESDPHDQVTAPARWLLNNEATVVHVGRSDAKLQPRPGPLAVTGNGRLMCDEELRAALLSGEYVSERAYAFRQLLQMTILSHNRAGVRITNNDNVRPMTYDLSIGCRDWEATWRRSKPGELDSRIEHGGMSLVLFGHNQVISQLAGVHGPSWQPQPTKAFSRALNGTIFHAHNGVTITATETFLRRDGNGGTASRTRTIKGTRSFLGDRLGTVQVSGNHTTAEFYGGNVSPGVRDEYPVDGRIVVINDNDVVLRVEAERSKALIRSLGLPARTCVVFRHTNLTFDPLGRLADPIRARSAVEAWMGDLADRLPTIKRQLNAPSSPKVADTRRVRRPASGVRATPLKLAA